MKTGVVSLKREIDSPGANEQIIHLTFRPSNSAILSIVTQCPGVKALHVTTLHMKNISISTKMVIGSLHNRNIRKQDYRSAYV
jgi:hypothetical protein